MPYLSLIEFSMRIHISVVYTCITHKDIECTGQGNEHFTAISFVSKNVEERRAYNCPDGRAGPVTLSYYMYRNQP
jgi:hypothetical protein